jgi:sulfur dioxygenase
MGEHTKADVVSMRVDDGDKINIEGVALDVLDTPGHTDDSYSFTMADRVFTGDTLLIRGLGERISKMAIPARSTNLFSADC